MSPLLFWGFQHTEKMRVHSWTNTLFLKTEYVNCHKVTEQEEEEGNDNDEDNNSNGKEDKEERQQ